MIRRKRSFGPRVKRPTLWTGAGFSNYSLSSGSGTVGSKTHFILTFPFSYENVDGWPNLIDATLQRTFLEFSALYGLDASNSNEPYFGYGLQVATYNASGSVDVGLPGPLTDPGNDWVMHGFILGTRNGVAGSPDVARFWGAQFGGSGERVESKAKRRLRDDEVLVLTLEGIPDGGDLGFSFGMRMLFRGR